MRLAVFTNQFPGRVNTFFARDMRGLIEAGVEVHVFPLYPLDHGLWRWVPKILDRDVLPRHRVHHVSLGLCGSRQIRGLIPLAAAMAAEGARYGLAPVLKSFYSLAKTARWHHLFGTGWDHLLAYWGNYSAACAYAFHQLTGVPYSILLHAGTDLYRNAIFLRQKMLHARHVLVVCDFNRQYIREHYADIYPALAPKIDVHHLGLDLSVLSFSPGGRPEAKLIGVGRLAKGKGFDDLLRAVRCVRDRGLDVEVELVGDGPEAEALRRLAVRLGLEAQVRFLGWLAPDRVPCMIRGATALVHASVWQRDGNLDAVPTVIKEALAVGTPVIASNIAGIPELLDQGRCGLLTRPGDVPSLTAAIESLLRNEALCSRLAMAGRQYAETHFDLWRNTRVLARLLSAHRPVDPAIDRNEQPASSHLSSASARR